MGSVHECHVLRGVERGSDVSCARGDVERPRRWDPCNWDGVGLDEGVRNSDVLCYGLRAPI